MKSIKKILNGFRWTTGVSFVLMGISSIKTDGVLAAVFSGLLGAWMLPVVQKKAKGVYPKLKAWQSILAGVAMFFAWGMALPATGSVPEDASGMVSEIESLEIVEDYTAEIETETQTETQAEETTEVIVETQAHTEAVVLDEVVDLGQMKVHFLDVGQGLSILVQVEDKTLVYDGGDKSTSSYVVSYLKENDVKTIDYLVSSHYDSDHVYGLIGCLNAFEVKNVISSDYEHDSDTYDKFVSAVQKEGLRMQHPKVGAEFVLGSAKFVILSPEKISKNDANENSVAIKLVHGENAFVFTGDATINSEAEMIRSDIDLECDVLSLGHHGSATSTSWDFLQASVPEYAVLSCGKNNQYGHPDEDVMEKLESMEIDLFRTDKQGEIVAISNGVNLTWNVTPCNDYTQGQVAEEETTAPTQPSSSQNESTQASNQQESNQQAITTDDTTSNEVASGEMVWLSATGKKYHSINDCGTMNPSKARQVTLEYALSKGYPACKNCH